jgi:hypothetical protein
VRPTAAACRRIAVYRVCRRAGVETGGDVATIDFKDFHPADKQYYCGLFT